MIEKKVYDAIVVGSGASGSFAAMALTQQGLSVLQLEAGKNITPEDFPSDLPGPKEKGIELWARAKATLCGQPQQAKVAFYGPHQRHLFVNDLEHPYSTPKDSPFLWIRGKQLGGRLHTFGRVLMRWSDTDFKAAERDGVGINWPISYADLEPYYDQVESLLQVRGCPAGLDNLPDGNFAGPSHLTQSERDIKQAISAQWTDRTVIPWRFMPANIKRVPVPILKAKETDLLTLITDAVVTRILTDSHSGLATGVEYRERITGQHARVKARLVMVCASPIESIRLLLNSAGGKHPKGIGNNTDHLGRYFMDQVANLIMGSVPGRSGFEVDETLPADPFYGRSGGMYIPRYENINRVTNDRFLRGFSYQGTSGRLFSPADKPSKFAIMGFGEMLPHKDNRITLNLRRKDRWGVPIPHIDCRPRENEQKMLSEQCKAIAGMVEAAGLSPEWAASSQGLQEYGPGAFPHADWLSRTLFRTTIRKSLCMGAAIHESGGARMGDSPENSVLNGHNQCWDAPNIFVTDASSFTSGGSCGTTLTIMALSLRAGEYAAQQLSSGAL